MTCYSPSPCKPMLASLALVGFICLLLIVGSLEEGEAAATARESGGSLKETTAVASGGGKLLHPEWHLNYMSKRRVPNGPDPIHNRRAGNSGRPPGRA